MILDQTPHIAQISAPRPSQAYVLGNRTRNTLMNAVTGAKRPPGTLSHPASRIFMEARR